MPSAVDASLFYFTFILLCLWQQRVCCFSAMHLQTHSRKLHERGREDSTPWQWIHSVSNTAVRVSLLPCFSVSIQMFTFFSRQSTKLLCRIRLNSYKWNDLMEKCYCIHAYNRRTAKSIFAFVRYTRHKCLLFELLSAFCSFDWI